MHLLTCHCGDVRLELAGLPASLTECNCSVCRRYAALWGYLAPDQVQLQLPTQTKAYVWGDQSIEFHHCPNCGCVTHYVSLTTPRIAVNFRLAEPGLTAQLPVRHFDGADSWKYID